MNKWVKSLLPLIGVVMLSACGTSKKVVNVKEGLYQSANELSVRIKDGWLSAKTVSLGDYTSSSKTNGIAAQSPARQFKRTSDAFYLNVKGNEVDMPVQVVSTPKITFSNRRLPSAFEKVSNDAPLWYIHIGPTAQNPLQSWELITKKDISYLEANDNKVIGVLRSSNEDIRISAHNRFGTKNSLEQLCYEFTLRGIPVAAVVTGNNPKAWIYLEADPSLQRVLSAAMTAIVFRDSK